MNIQKFVAPSAREALAKARHAFGDATLILSNRTTQAGVEVMATTDEALQDMGVVSQERAISRAGQGVQGRQGHSSVADDADQLSMSTLSFQDYVRERMLRRRHEASQAGHRSPQTAGRSGVNPRAKPTAAHTQAFTTPALTTPLTSSGASDTSAQPSALHPAPNAAASATQVEAARRDAHTLEDHLADELRSVKSLIEERFNTLDWLGQVRRQPVQANLMLQLLKSGFSPALSRAMVEKLPPDAPATEAMDWIHQVLQRNLKLAASGGLIEQGGIFALVGATGVGKTSTVAKLAAQCAHQHGAASVGLITLDTYKTGAHEQLRQLARSIGVVAHLAHDQAALQDLLQLLAAKRVVLIDTAGLAPRDPRISEMLELLNLPAIERVLVLQASSQAETMEDTVHALRTGTPLSTLLTKTDEAVKLAPAIDVLVRHQLVLKGCSHGQRLLEDWHLPDKAQLIRQALRNPPKSAFEPQLADLSYLFSAAASVGSASRMH